MKYSVNTQSSNFDDIAAEALELINFAGLINYLWMKNNPNHPCCLGCLSIKYIPPPINYRSNEIEIDNVELIIQKGFGKCDDIVAFYIAKQWLNNKPANPILEEMSPGLFHAKAEIYENGRWIVVDPSKKLDLHGFEDNNCRTIPHVCAC